MIQKSHTKDLNEKFDKLKYIKYDCEFAVQACPNIPVNEDCIYKFLGI